jgi:hypothetical protein
MKFSRQSVRIDDMKNLMTAFLLVITATLPARADFVFTGTVDTTALGFGDVHRLQTVTEPTSGTGVEAGTVSPSSLSILPTLCTGQADCTGSGDKSTTPTIGTLSWTSGSQVGLGVDISQTGALSDGLNLNNFGIQIYDASGVAISGATFSLALPFLITAAMGHVGPGNGTDVFDFALNAAEQATWDSFHFASSDVVGSFTNFGCLGAVSSSCQPANDGPDSLLAFVQPAAVPGPVLGGGLPGLLAGLLGLIGLARLRQRRLVKLG